MKVIYIHIETSKREYLSRLLSAFFATRMGYKVLIGDVLSFFEKLKNLKEKKGIFHFKDIAPSDLNFKLFNNLKENNFLITSIDEEGGLEYEKYHSKDFNSFLTSRYSVDTLLLVDKIFTWGKFDYESLVENFPKFNDKFLNTGNPRVDFCKTKLDTFYEQLDLNEMKDEKKPILIISDIGNIMSSKKLSEQIYINRESQKYLNEIKDEREVDQLSIYSNKILYLSELIKLVKNLTKKFPNEKFIFRPHPTESKDDWNKILGNHKNLEIIKDRDATYWIRKSKLMVHNSCYTAIDGAILKKPIISFCPSNCIKSKKYFTGKIGVQTNTIDEVEKNIEYLINNPKHFDENILLNFELINSRLNLDGISAQKQAEAWHELIDKNNLEINNFNFKFLLFFLRINYLMKSFIKKLFFTKSKQFTKFDELNSSKINENLNYFEKVFNDEKKRNYKVSKINKYLCFIESKF